MVVTAADARSSTAARGRDVATFNDNVAAGSIFAGADASTVIIGRGFERTRALDGERFA